METPITNVPAPTDYTQVSSLCTQPTYDPLVLGGAFLWALRQHFADPALIQEPEIRKAGYLWNSDPTRTGLVIAMSHLWDPQRVSRRPAIFLKRNAVRPRRLSIAHAYHPSAIDSGEKFETMIVGSHTAFVIDKRPGVVELLANEVFYLFLEQGGLLGRELGLARVEVVGMEGLKRLEEDDDLFVVPVVVGWARLHAWRLRSVEVLQKISLTVNES